MAPHNNYMSPLIEGMLENSAKIAHTETVPH